MRQAATEPRPEEGARTKPRDEPLRPHEIRANAQAQRARGADLWGQSGDLEWAIAQYAPDGVDDGEELEMRLPRLFESLVAFDGGPGLEELSASQRDAVEWMFTLLQSPQYLRIEPGTLADGVKPASWKVLAALSQPLRSPHGSMDIGHPANVDHLGAVLRGAFEREAARLERPLSQPEADALALTTVLTDSWMKGRSTDEILDAPTAPTNLGSTVRELDAHFKAEVRRSLDLGGSISPNVRALLDRFVEQRTLPMDSKSLAREGERAGLSSAEQHELRMAWSERLFTNGQWVNVQDKMRGVLLHGLIGYEPVKQAVEASGLKLDPREVYLAVVGHHVSGFIAAGLSRLGVEVDFEKMEREGQLPPGGAKQLADLYQASLALSGKWRNPIDLATVSEAGGLSEAQRREYLEDAAPLRAAVERLPEPVRAQLIEDDEMQFVPQAMAKWIAMQRAGTNAQMIAGVYRSVQPYYEEARARQPDVGAPRLAERARVSAERLGYTYDEARGVFHEAGPKDAAFHTFAEGIAQNVTTRVAFLKAQGADPTLSPQQTLNRFGDLAVVTWFRTSPGDRMQLIRLAQGRYTV